MWSIGLGEGNFNLDLRLYDHDRPTLQSTDLTISDFDLMGTILHQISTKTLRKIEPNHSSTSIVL